VSQVIDVVSAEEVKRCKDHKDSNIILSKSVYCLH